MVTFLLEGRAVRGRCQNVIKCDVFACESARKCSLTLKYFDPGKMFNQQRFLNVWALAAVQFDICE